MIISAGEQVEVGRLLWGLWELVGDLKLVNYFVCLGGDYMLVTHV